VSDTNHSLIDQHTKAIQDDASPRFCIADQLCAGRVWNDIRNDHIRLKAIRIEIEPSVDIGKKSIEVAFTTMLAVSGPGKFDPRQRGQTWRAFSR
jgi:hypothetical protein